VPSTAPPNRAPYLDHDGLALYLGDALAVLRELPDESADMAVTSPPFFGLRDYGTARWEGGDPDCGHLAAPAGGPRTPGDGFRDTEAPARKARQFRDVCGRCGAVRVDEQVGLEDSPAAYVERLVAIFREVRRVLKPHGCLLLELGDAYCSAPRGNSDGSAHSSGLTNPDRQAKVARPQGRTSQRAGRRNAREQRSLEARFDGIKSKDLMGMPWEIAFALRADGWWLRRRVRLGPPEPDARERDRPLHDLPLARLPPREVGALLLGRRGDPRGGRREDEGELVEEARLRSARTRRSKAGKVRHLRPRREYELRPPPAGTPQRLDDPDGAVRPGPLPVCHAFWPRNAPDDHCGVEVVSHYAAFPVALAEKAILAASSAHGVCPDCGSRGGDRREGRARARREHVERERARQPVRDLAANGATSPRRTRR
jgi:hypothetical protein